MRVSTKVGSNKSTRDTLTETGTYFPNSSFHFLIWAAASFQTYKSSCSIKPFSSKRGMKTPGEIKPLTG